MFAVVQAVRPLPTPSLTLTAEDSYTFDGSKVNLPWPTEGQGWMDVNGIGTMGNFGKQTPVAIGSVAKAMTASAAADDAAACAQHTDDGATHDGGTRLTRFVDRLRAPFLRHPVIGFTLLSGVLHVVWFFTFANSGGDLAAQDAWAEFVGLSTPTRRTTSPGTAACTRCRTAWSRRTSCRSSASVRR